MYSCPIQLSDVRYNATTQSFEALVTVHDNATRRRYACAVTAPITTSFEDAARSLAKQAVQLHQQQAGSLSSAVSVATQRPAPRLRFDVTRWLRGVAAHRNASPA